MSQEPQFELLKSLPPVIEEGGYRERVIMEAKENRAHWLATNSARPCLFKVGDIIKTTFVAGSRNKPFTVIALYAADHNCQSGWLGDIETFEGNGRSIIFRGLDIAWFSLQTQPLL